MQCGSSRGLLDWTQEDLARKVGVSALTIRNFEGGRTAPNPATMTVLRLAFEKAGIEFLDDGVKLRKGTRR